MRTMREIRIKRILAELSDRIASYNTTMDTLRDDFGMGRRASMQIRKEAQKVMRFADVEILRFLSIAKSVELSQDSAMYTTFHNRRAMFNELELFFH